MVSRYKEDLKWTLEAPFNRFYYLVYNKGDNTEFEKSRVLGVCALPNVGMCDHTYLYHLYTHYETIADITVFLPGSCNMPNKVDTARRLLTMVAQRNRACIVDAMRAPRGMFEEMKMFTLDYWNVSCTDNHNNAQRSDDESPAVAASGKLTPARIRPFGRWYRAFFARHAPRAGAGAGADTSMLPLQGVAEKHGQKEYVPVTYWWNRGIFSVSRENVHRRPRELYAQLMGATGQSVAPETSHYMERAWSTLFFPLVNTDLCFMN